MWKLTRNLKNFHLIGLRNSGGEDFVSADKKFSIPLSPAKLSLLSKSPIGSKSKDFNNRDESVRQNVSVHISKEGAERNLEGGSFFEVSKKVQIEEFLNRLIEIRNQNKTLSPAVTQMPAIDLTDTLQELNIEGVGVNSVLERGRRLERQIDDGSNRTLVRDLSVSGEVGALKSGRPQTTSAKDSTMARRAAVALHRKLFFHGCRLSTAP